MKTKFFATALILAAGLTTSVNAFAVLSEGCDTFADHFGTFMWTQLGTGDQSFFAGETITVSAEVPSSGTPTQVTLKVDDVDGAVVDTAAYPGTVSYKFSASGIYSVVVSVDQGESTFLGSCTEDAAATAPDVSVTSVEVLNGAHNPGTEMTVTVVLKNNGTSGSGAFNIKIYASTNSTISGSDTLLGTVAVSSIAAGASMTVEAVVVVPAGLATGDWFIGVIIDINDDNAGNNAKADPVSVFVPASNPPPSRTACFDLAGASVFSSEDRPVFLGFFGNASAPDSINNPSSPYGSNSSGTSVRNNSSIYGNTSGSFSVANGSALKPPKIVINGRHIGYLSINGSLGWQSFSLATIDASCTFTNTSPGALFKRHQDAAEMGWGGFDISMGGSWWNPLRSGEGVVFDFFSLPPDGTAWVAVYFYTYDTQGNALYLVGAAQITPGSTAPIEVDVFSTSGTPFGAAFEPNDVIRVKWGTLVIEFFTCGTGRVIWEPLAAGFLNGSVDIERLVPLGEGITCP